MTLRDEIDAVPWAQLSHAYGPAEDTPGHLFSLLSDNPEDFARALDGFGRLSVIKEACTRRPALLIRP